METYRCRFCDAWHNGHGKPEHKSMRCNAYGLVCHSSRERAEAEVARLNGKRQSYGKLLAYLCDGCGYWHVQVEKLV